LRYGDRREQKPSAEQERDLERKVSGGLHFDTPGKKGWQAGTRAPRPPPAGILLRRSLKGVDRLTSFLP
jgi:hypothetical protein